MLEKFKLLTAAEQAQEITKIWQSSVMWYDQTYRIMPDNYAKLVPALDFFSQNMAKDAYIKRGAVDGEKIEKDIWLGKLAEMTVWEFMCRLGFPSSVVPDFTIQPVADKNYEADLKYQAYDILLPNVHVKSCDVSLRDRVLRQSATRCNERYSWTFTKRKEVDDGKGERLFIDPKFDHDVVVFTFTPEGKANNVVIVGTAPVWIIKQKNLLEAPAFDKFKAVKECVYGSKLEELSKQGVQHVA